MSYAALPIKEVYKTWINMQETEPSIYLQNMWQFLGCRLVSDLEQKRS